MYNQHPSHWINSIRSIGCFRRLLFLGMSISFRYSKGNKLKISLNSSSSLPPHDNNVWKPHMCCVIALIKLEKLFLLISNFKNILVVASHLEFSREQGNCHHQQLYLAAVDQLCHRKWGPNFALKSNTINPKAHHYQPFVLPPKVSEKLAAIYLLIHITHWKISLPLLLSLKNARITLRHKAQQLKNMYAKACKQYLHHYFS